MHRAPPRAFSLLEVVVAIGVFALGIVVVIGLFAPVTKSVGRNAEAEMATSLADVIRSELNQRVRAGGSLQPVIALLKTGSALVGVASPDDVQLLFASRDGAKIGSYDAAVWVGAGTEKFFEIALFRNETLSPPNVDAAAIVVVYTARIRWPALMSGQNRAGQQEVWVNGSIRR